MTMNTPDSDPTNLVRDRLAIPRRYVQRTEDRVCNFNETYMLNGADLVVTAIRDDKRAATWLRMYLSGLGLDA